MTVKTYTVSEVVELQNQRSQLEQRLAIHRQRAIDKSQELSALFAQEGVSNLTELSELCAKTNAAMQEYAKLEEQTLAQMRAHCDELDRML